MKRKVLHPAVCKIFYLIPQVPSPGREGKYSVREIVHYTMYPLS
jgi:hypothetical protein